MKTKIISFVLLAVLLFTLSACSKDNTDNSLQSNIFNPDSSQSQPSDSPDVSSQDNSDIIKITIPEGYTLLKTAWLLEEKGLCSTQDFINAAQNYSLTSNDLLTDLSSKENVCFKLEGYLFPATYSFKKGTEPTDIIQKMVSTSSSKFTAEMRQRATELGYSIHDILTVASIIEKEAYTEEQRTLISSTLYNRLNKKMKLQCDVTTKYCTGVIELQYPDQIDTYKYYYNTYRCDGLPAGPICNPGLASINAALYPDKTDYLYFVINTEPPYESAFSATYDEHLANCKRMGY